MAKKNQSKRLTDQHKESHGVVGIFGTEAKSHDVAVGKIALGVMEQLKADFPQLAFRHRKNITSANYGMPINKNLCKNKFVKHKDKTVMLQAASIYTQGNGEKWDSKEMFDIMLEISQTALKALGSEIFNQLTENIQKS